MSLSAGGVPSFFMKMKGKGGKNVCHSFICGYEIIKVSDFTILSYVIVKAVGKPGDIYGFGGYFACQFF